MARSWVPTTVLIVASLGGGTRLSAQRKELTLIGGATYSRASGPNLSRTQGRAGFLGGLSLRLPRSAQVSFQSEFRVTQRRLFGERAPSTLPPIQSGPRTDEPNIIYGEVAVLFRMQQGYSMQRPIRPFLLLGPYIGARLWCRHLITEEDGRTREDTCDSSPAQYVPGSNTSFPAAYHIIDVGLMGGLGVEVRRISLGIRFERSLNSLVESGAIPTSPFDNSKLWSASVAVEYLLRVL